MSITELQYISGGQNSRWNSTSTARHEKFRVTLSLNYTIVLLLCHFDRWDSCSVARILVLNTSSISVLNIVTCPGFGPPAHQGWPINSLAQSRSGAVIPGHPGLVSTSPDSQWSAGQEKCRFSTFWRIAIALNNYRHWTLIHDILIQPRNKGRTKIFAESILLPHQSGQASTVMKLYTRKK